MLAFKSSILFRRLVKERFSSVKYCYFLVRLSFETKITYSVKPSSKNRLITRHNSNSLDPNRLPSSLHSTKISHINNSLYLGFLSCKRVASNHIYMPSTPRHEPTICSWSKTWVNFISLHLLSPFRRPHQNTGQVPTWPKLTWRTRKSLLFTIND